MSSRLVLVSCLQTSTSRLTKKLVTIQPADAPTTYADTTALERDFGFTPKIKLQKGLRKFAEWYKGYYRSDV